MINSKHTDRICIFISILAVLLTVLFMNGEALGIEKIVDGDAESYDGTEYFTANDLDAAWDDSAATVITCNGTDAVINGNGAYTYNGDVVISNTGYYVVSGTLTDGSLIVDAHNSSKVWIRLAGVDITCSDDAGIRVNQAEKVFLTLAEGTENSVTSGAVYSDSALSDNAGGAVFSHDDLTINGSGTLTVTASYKHGFDVNDALVLAGGEIIVTAPADGLHVNDSVRITGTTLTINAADDAIHCDTEAIIADGTIRIDECYEGIEAPQITVEGGDITIYTSDDGFNANGGSSMFGGMGGFPGSVQDTAQTDGTAADIEPFLLINGGNITIINETGRDADGLDSNGDITINGGTVLVSLTDGGSNSAIDYGSESGGVCIINGGTVIACGSYAMAEHFDETSMQPAILYNFTSGAEAGETIALEDADGNVLLTWEVPCSFSSANISCPEISLGESYRVV
ncbi:MAG: carbohydrate-binding domain-containing protein, partial [Butyrivibrio sp.]|nr:carbohydrate-binding domain-containing protein [Butyrivibrio sp.]